jgi:hypothetical protein
MAIILDGTYAYHTSQDGIARLTIHPKTGRLVKESSLQWPEDYPPKEVAYNLRCWYGPGARTRAIELGAWEAAMILEEKQ